MASIKIHRGSHQIGGSIAEIYTENTHVFIDFGAELTTDPEKSTDAEMIDMIRHARCDAVLFTHYHGDHVGLIRHVPKRDVEGHPIKLGLGKAARMVLENIHGSLADLPHASAEEKKMHEEYLELLRDRDRILDIEGGVPIFLGEARDVKVTPVMVYLHTGGHATADDIAELILTVRPKEVILPIHTEHPEKFRELEIGEYKDLIDELNDSCVVDL